VTPLPKWTTAGRKLDVAATGEAGLDLDNTVGTLGATQIATAAITSDKVAANALDGKGDWNIGKTGYALTTAAILAIWHQLTSAIVTAGSIGKLLKDDTPAIKMVTDKFVFTKANEVDANTKSINDAEVVGDGNATPWDGV